MEKAVRNTSKVFNAIAMAILAILMFQGTADVIGRYLFNSPIQGTGERNAYGMAVLIFLGWAYTQIAKGHVRVELFISRFSPRTQAIANFTISFVALVLFSLIAWQGIVMFKLLHESGRLISVIDWPIAPFQLFVALGALVLCLVLILDMLAFLRQMKAVD